MKIVCDNCATKYSIADEKVRGKVFKIRCKKCSHIIVVRGGADGSVEASSSRDAGPADGGFPGGGGGEEQQTIAARGATGGEVSGDAVWHLVIDREQVGPLSPSEVRAKFSGGEVDAETYAWREGFGDWLRLGSIEDFRDLGGDAPAAPDAGATRRTDSADLFAGAGGSDEASDAPAGDLFGGGAPAPAYSSAPAPSNEDVFGNGGGGALFSAPSAAPAPARQSRASSPSFSSSSASAESASASSNGNVVDVRPMTGQRNENSVLFSLNNLQALATGGAGGGKSNQSGGGGSSENRPGFANSQTEGSGLIDIRAMAASTLAASPSTGGLGSGPGELPGLGAAPVFSPMAAPILMPAAPSGPPKWMWAILGVGVLAVLGIVVVGALLLTRKPAEPTVIAQAPTAAAPVAAAPSATAAKPSAAAPAATAPAVAAATPGAAATPAAEKQHAAKGPKVDKPVKVAKNEPAAKAAAEAPAAAAPVAAAAPAPKHSGGKRDELDDLLNGASPGDTPKQKKAAAAAADTGGGSSDENLPDTLGKGEIVSGMSKVKGRVQGCFDQFKVPGTANVAITIASSGHVSSANVTGQFAGTPTGECVAKAVKSASFSKFKGSPMSFVYPYLLR